MGCVQGRPESMNSPPKGLDKLKQENGYITRRGSGNMDPRRSTGQRHLQEGPTGRRQPLIPRGKGGGGGSGGGGGGRFGGAEVERAGNGSSGDVFGLGRGEEETVDGWPKWLVNNVPRHVLKGLVPKSADSYDKIDKVGQGTYSNVYKARDRETGKLVALKKVRFDTSEPESIKFMAREIMILRELDHPNVVKLEGLATSRMQYSLYLVFEYMVSDLQRIITRPDERLTEPQIKRYMHQLLSGLQHCHEKGILHRDIKGSNLLIDKTGTLKIGDFGLANYYKPRERRPLTNRVVTLWYRAPELLLGATDYGAGIDLWSAGCLLAEMLAGRPILPGRTEVEQIHRIFKLCGTPPEDYWKKMKLPTTFRPRQTYKSSIVVSFSDFPNTSIALLNSLLALDPAARGSASSALEHEYFHTRPLPCDPSELPIVHQPEDELAFLNEQKMRRRLKAKRRARLQRERKKKDLETEKPTADNEPKQKEEEPAQKVEQTQEPGSSMSSNISGLKPNQPVLIAPPFIPSPDVPVNKTVYPSGGSPSGSRKNNLPLPPSISSSTRYIREKDAMYRLNQVNRSASTREFRRPNQRKHLERYALED
ncbi:probable serine/threonine-protein kinase At1g54610 isoform X2 [Punica granatum]|uniref:Probable serine/threonine-protein kinase At1g54610 isoform X2 n=1 Tax=Punica granatum TaxID=22663 RepID=A0A6P8BMK0_PUNGR|nr:probable serine/threonine-protein kinase At1g54610 isoform X2 [Punica granatum]